MKKILLMFILIGSVVLGEVKTQLKSMKISKSGDGKIERVEAKNVSPGDILEYTFMIDNEEQEVIKNLNPTIPVPSGTSLIPDTGKPSNYLVSVNGRDFYKYPIEVDGKPVPLSDYKSVGWNVEELKPGEKLEFKVEVKLNGGEGAN
ncbi:hypothetical protein [uncultured Cetobacterium sp.]|uniref:hypothetical protein n=1 Tax=uncultured Cetobacterium sp. TaxID=527638 RepID=UPI002635D7C1|nr:hypothetical protein [uncultured Cetobacterium sp.]